MNLYLMEERNLIQTSKLNWLKFRDENTNFFHRFLSAKKRKNMITELVSSDGLILHSYHEIEAEISGYFASLYTKILGFRAIPSNMPWKRASAAQNSALIAPFCSEEILQAI